MCGCILLEMLPRHQRGGGSAPQDGKKNIPENSCKDKTKLGQPTSLDVILGSSYDLEQLAVIEGRMTARGHKRPVQCWSLSEVYIQPSKDIYSTRYPWHAASPGS